LNHIILKLTLLNLVSRTTINNYTIDIGTKYYRNSSTNSTKYYCFFKYVFLFNL